ncbi:MAG: hypothetical protein MJ149_01400, partial [Clostridia bacterium]|nr:hypothetical protein [Clostridia bacterium]
NSPEHDISIITGMQLAKNLGAKFPLQKIYLGLDNNFYLATEIENLNYFGNKQNIKLKQVVFLNGAVYKISPIFKKLFEVECVFNCCHGGVGENGDLAGFFNLNNIKYTSAECLPSHIAMDKALTKQLLKDKVNVVEGVLVDESNKQQQLKLVEQNLSEELIVKPNALGSSIGVKACNKKDYKKQVEAIFLMHDSALVENRIVEMEEFNQACFICNGELVLSAIENPISKSKFLTFDEKYNGGSKKGTDRILPAKISKDLEEEIYSNTKTIYSTLKLSGVVRVDYIFDKSTQKLYFNEVNTIPGSMAFYLYEPVGIDYITLCEKLSTNLTEEKAYSYFDTKVLSKKLL